MAMRASQGSESVTGAYGRSLGAKLGAEDAPSIVTRSLHATEIAVTEICVHRPTGRLSDPIPRVDAYMICLMLRDIPNNAYWEEGRQVSAYSLRAGEVTIHDLRREPLAVIDKPIHSLLCYIPSAALNALADQANVPRISELRYKPGLGLWDETIKHVGLSLLPALRTPDRVTRLFTDHVALALATHCAQAYGGMQTVS
jgi:AraC family transcriptional regulator